MNTPKIGETVSVSFRTDGNCDRVKTSPVIHKIQAVYTDKDQYDNPKVKLDNGDVFYITKSDKGLWYAIK